MIEPDSTRRSPRPGTLHPQTAAAGFLRRYDQATSKDVADLAQVMRWFEDQGAHQERYRQREAGQERKG